MMGKKKPSTVKKINPFFKIFPSFNDDKTQEKNSIGQLASAHDQLFKIEEYLNSAVDALHDNPSFLTRMANRWGGFPGWAKIVGGILFFGILFTVGILAHLAVIIGITAVTASGFTVCSVMLDDHYKTNKQSKDTLKSGMLSLGSLLKSTIMALDKICEQLATEIEQFKQENHRLAESLKLLDEELRSLHIEIDTLSGANEALQALQLKFEKTSTTYEACRQLLQTRVDELEQIKIKMATQIKEQERMVGVLQGTLETFSVNLVKNEADQSIFIQKMKDFIQGGSVSFAMIAERVSQAETELLKTQEALRESNLRYEQLIEKHTDLLERFDKSLSESLAKDRVTMGAMRFPFLSKIEKKKCDGLELVYPDGLTGANSIF